MHAAICLKEGGSISNFRSKEGQLKHGEVIIYCSSTRVMKDSSRQGSFHICRAFYHLHKRGPAELYYTFIAAVAASQTAISRFPDASSLEFLQKCGKIFQEVLCTFPGA